MEGTAGKSKYYFSISGPLSAQLLLTQQPTQSRDAERLVHQRRKWTHGNARMINGMAGFSGLLSG